MRIVSLSPSITRQLIDLDAEDMLAGVTALHPPLSKPVPVIGSMLRPNSEKIILLKPDIVLLSEEDSATQSVGFLETCNLNSRKFGRNGSFEDICKNYIELGRLIGKEQLAEQKAAVYAAQVKAARAKQIGLTVLLLVAHEPLITASDKSFVGRIITDAGGSNCFKELAVPYPIVSPEAVIKKNPHVMLAITQGGADYLRQKFSGFNLAAYNNDLIAEISPERLTYYTPADYASAVRELSEILTKAKEKLSK